jgi:ketosteroid isomerase-like protein
VIRRFCITALVGVASVFGSVAVAVAAEPALPQVTDVIAAERAFARMSTEKGIKPAFVANLAADAVIFRPGPVPAQDWYAKHPASTATLEWSPDLAAIAVTGDMGFTSGPWTLTNGEQQAHGHFVTVWRHEKDGTWKAVLDGGASHAPVDLEVEPVIPAWCEPRELEEVRTHGEKRKSIGTRDALLNADHELGEHIVAQGWAAAMAASAADDMRLCRPGQLPVDGKDGVLKVLADAPGALACSPVSGSVSRGDLGYTYGTLLMPLTSATASKDSAAGFAYIRIWRRDAAGRQVVAVDAMSSMGTVAKHPGAR